MQKAIVAPYKSVTAAFGATIRARRRMLDMTQEQLAEKSGVARSSIALYESGHGNPTLGQTEALVFALGGALAFEFDPVPGGCSIKYRA
jgi:transcriptional regulator with XRE-family HTH domain